MSDQNKKEKLKGDYQYFGMARAIDVLCKAFVTGEHMSKSQ